MTEPPPMVPSAEFRLHPHLAVTHPGYSEVRYTLICAYRDGFAAGVQAERASREAELAALFDAAAEYQPSAMALEFAHDQRWPNDRIDIARFCDAFAKAERARIIAELREPSDEMLRAVWEGYKVEGNWTFAISEALRALADHLEHQTTTVGRID